MQLSAQPMLLSIFALSLSTQPMQLSKAALSLPIGAMQVAVSGLHLCRRAVFFPKKKALLSESLLQLSCSGSYHSARISLKVAWPSRLLMWKK